MGNTKIPYVDKSWNSSIGCTPITSGCQNCWACELHNQRHRAWLQNTFPSAPKQYYEPFNKIQLRPDRLEEPLHWRKPQTIFVNSMSDTFHKDVPFEFIDQIFRVMKNAAQHTFLIFTKRFERAQDYFNRMKCDPVVDRIQLFFSASKQAEVDQAQSIILQIPAAKRGLSLEPLLEPIDLKLGECTGCGYPLKACNDIERPKYITCCPDCKHPLLDSIIVGCESGPNRRPCNIEWIRRIVKQGQEAGIAVYVKQIDLGYKVSTKPEEWPPDVRVKEWVT